MLTEAQFERALRGGRADHKYPWGTELAPTTTVGNFADRSASRSYGFWKVIPGYDDGFARVSPAKSFPPNEFGLYDLSGNVFEWCADGYDEQYYDRSPGLDPLGPESSSAIVIRGGSSQCPPDRLRASSRNHCLPIEHNSYVGFRCARTLP